MKCYQVKLSIPVNNWQSVQRSLQNAGYNKGKTGKSCDNVAAVRKSCNCTPKEYQNLKKREYY